MTGNGEGSRREKTPGTMIVVVGPSGAGKDTLMDYAATELSGRPGFHFTRRVITRSGDAGGENHDAVSMQEFNRLQDEGAFAVSWQAHGLKYGIPAAVYRQLEAGDVVIANGSRSALPEFSSAFSRLRVVNIVARPEVLARRLEQRGRASRACVGIKPPAHLFGTRGRNGAEAKGEIPLRREVTAGRYGTHLVKELN